jgi:hypothetical protein
LGREFLLHAGSSGLNRVRPSADSAPPKTTHTERDVDALLSVACRIKATKLTLSERGKQLADELSPVQRRDIST